MSKAVIRHCGVCSIRSASIRRAIAYGSSGDLVNRGPQSLATLRFVKSLGTRAITVLGNHDLHLLVVAAGHAKIHHGDTLDAILRAPDRDELLDWTRRRKMMHAAGRYAIVHAGLLPQWTIAKALKLAREVEVTLQGEDCDEFFRHMYGNQPDRWRDESQGLRSPARDYQRAHALTPLHGRRKNGIRA